MCLLSRTRTALHGGLFLAPAGQDSRSGYGGRVRMSGIAQAGRAASHGEAPAGVARAGLTARAVVYLLMGALALALALGRSSAPADQRGALAALAERSGGAVLLGLLAVGLAAYALWRVSEVVSGPVGEPDGTGARAKSLLRAVVYTGLAVTAVAVLSGRGGSQGDQQQGLTARVLGETGGRWLVGVVGVAVVVAGATMVHEGVTRAFERRLRTAQMSSGTRTLVRRLGTVGTVARGLVIGLTGALVVQAAVTSRPDRARGLDGALRTLADQPYGQALLVAAALGLLCFGAYGLAEARWHRT